MTTLTQTPVAPLLDRLFAEAAAAPGPDGAGLPEDELERMMRSRTEYRSLYAALSSLWLPVSRETGQLLFMLARTARARSIVEFGTSFGLSTIHLAAALRDNGGGHLITTEFEPAKLARARRHLAEAGLADLVEFREGDALETLATGLPGLVDLVLLDGAKVLYPEVLTLLEPRLPPGALIVADNADMSPAYLARVRAPGSGYLSIPFAEEVELSMRLG